MDDFAEDERPTDLYVDEIHMYTIPFSRSNEKIPVGVDTYLGRGKHKIKLLNNQGHGGPDIDYMSLLEPTPVFTYVDANFEGDYEGFEFHTTASQGVGERIKSGSFSGSDALKINVAGTGDLLGYFSRMISIVDRNSPITIEFDYKLTLQDPSVYDEATVVVGLSDHFAYHYGGYQVAVGGLFPPSSESRYYYSRYSRQPVETTSETRARAYFMLPPGDHNIAIGVRLKQSGGSTWWWQSYRSKSAVLEIDNVHITTKSFEDNYKLDLVKAVDERFGYLDPLPYEYARSGRYMRLCFVCLSLSICVGLGGRACT